MAEARSKNKFDVYTLKTAGMTTGEKGTGSCINDYYYM